MSASPTYAFAAFLLDCNRRILTRDSRRVPLSPKEFQALLLLVEAGGHAVSRNTFIAALWPDTAVTDNSLARVISSLRRHLGPGVIDVVPKFGYRFALPLRQVLESGSPGDVHTERLQIAAIATPHSGVPVRAMPDELSAAGNTPGTQSAWSWPSVRNPPRSAGAVAALLLIVAGTLAATWPIARQYALRKPTWTDPQTHLTWARRDNGADVTLAQAATYCRQLSLGQAGHWRLPQIDELQTLYDPGTSAAGTWGPARPVYWHVKGNLHLSGGEVAGNLTWRTDLTPAGEEQSFDFSFGRRNYDAPDFFGDHRALCVLD
jgi:DNA-binding winged helix-turn-helix (wHTH) protein